MALYEEFTRRLRWQAAHLSDKIPWRMLAAPGVMLHKQTNALQRTYALRGPDLSGEAKEVQGALMLQANNVFKRLAGAWTIHSEAQRVRVTTYPESLWPHPTAALIDADRRHVILEDPGARETFYFLTLTWRPPSTAAQRWQRLVVSGPGKPEQDTAEGAQVAVVERFVTEADYLMDLLKGMLAMARPLTTDEMLTYLHSCVSDLWHPVRCPVLPIDLDVRLCDSPFAGGWYRQLGECHVRTCSIMAYPAMSVAGALKALESKDLDFRWCTRWIALDKHAQAGLLRKTQGAWVGQERSIFARMAESLSGKPTRMTDPAATNKAEEAKVAREELGADIVAFGEFTGTVTVWDQTPGAADEKRREVMQVLDSQGFISTPEKQHATPAWLSTHLGNRIDSVRRTPQHSLTLAHLCPGLQAAWPGPERDAYLNGPPWFLAHTDGSTLMRVVNHVLDNGHFLVLGPTRSGKSTLLGLMQAQWLKYPGAQVFCLDVGKSNRCLTLCLEGYWYDLGAGQVGLQPLSHIDGPVERAWCAEWLKTIIYDAGVKPDPAITALLDAALDALAIVPGRERTLSGLWFRLKAQSNRVNVAPAKRRALRSHLLNLYLHVLQALEPLTQQGRYGAYLDADHDDLQAGPVHTFEQETLLTMPRLVRPVMSYVFHRLEQRFDTSHPTLLLMDDAAVTWVLPDYEEKGKEWIVTKAKKGVSIGFFTHSLVQVFGVKLGSLLLESCPTRFILPNPAARTPQLAEIYHRMGCNEEELKLISTARPQRDCYYTVEQLGKRMFSLPLSPLLLTMISRNRAEDHEHMDKILERDGREGFAAAWLREQGFPEAATQVEEELRHVDETGLSGVAD